MDFADDHRRGDRIKCDQGLAGAADGHPWENGGEPISRKECNIFNM